VEHGQVCSEAKVKTTTDSASQLPVPVSSVGSHVSLRRTSTAAESASAAPDQKRLVGTLSSPFIRQDVFYAGSVTSLREYKTSHDMATYVQVHTYIPIATTWGHGYLRTGSYLYTHSHDMGTWLPTYRFIPIYP